MAYPVGVLVPQVPNALGRCATSVPLNEVGVERLQDVRGERERPDHLELLGLAQQAFEADAACLAAEAKECAAFVVAVAQELVEPPAHAIVEPREHVVEGLLLVFASDGTHETLEAHARRSFDPRVREPLANPVVERVILGLTRERVCQQPGMERLPRSLVERAHSEQLQAPHSMPPARSVVPSVAVEAIHRRANLLREVGHDGRREVAAVLGEPAVPPVKRELREQPEATLLLLVEEQFFITWLERPLLDQLLRRPLSLHRPGPLRRTGSLHQPRAGSYSRGCRFETS